WSVFMRKQYLPLELIYNPPNTEANRIELPRLGIRFAREGRVLKAQPLGIWKKRRQHLIPVPRDNYIGTETRQLATDQLSKVPNLIDGQFLAKSLPGKVT